MFFVYIIESTVKGSFYIGQTCDLEARIKRHNEGRNPSTKSGKPWKLLYWKEYTSRSESYCEEQNIKRLKSRNAIIKYITENNFRGIAQPG